ncbi:hypothetical protein J1C56_02040 [Aminobacter anthyllidis]|uniref:Uncharacterized protein n=1 Tax=Aminobacter anthyllidis TaxID=1035067 RepID=A0A9X1D0Y8_9HYPH|nr:hypothetical protein [Aminobacter anthyllidis]MBT1154365.1 hypothetical protein [Aminobacter anthyllidis]
MTGGSPGSGSGAHGGMYYGRGKIWYVQWARTGNSTYLTRARAQMSEFINNYIKNGEYGNNYSQAANWAMAEDVMLYYHDMTEQGDTAEAADALDALGRMASLWSDGYALDLMHTLNCREAAYPIRAIYWANLLSAPSVFWTSVPDSFTQGHVSYHQHSNWTDRLAAFLNKAMDKWNATGAGSGRWNDENNACKPFMNSLLRDSYILMYERNSGLDATYRTNLRNAIKASMDYEWANMWDVPAQAFDYSTGEVEETTPYADLNLMISPAYAWLANYYRSIGDTANAGTYATRHDTIFAGGVAGTDLNGSKQFNQNYTTAFRGPAWAHGITRA